MKKFYEEAEITVTKFDYEEVMIDVVSDGIPDNGGDFGDGDNEVEFG